MKYLKITSVFFLCFSFSLLNAQKGILKGIVTDQKNGEALIGATVVSGLSGVATDLDGTYILKLDAGTVEVKISYTGFEPITKKVVIKADAETELNVEMQDKFNILQEATVTGGKFDKPLGEQTVSLDILKARLITNTGATSIEKVLDKLPGVDIIDGQANIRGGSGFSGGAGSRVMLLIDDIPALQGDLGLAQWQDVPLEIIDRVEVLKGAASSLYGSAALNGVVNVRTIYPTSTPKTSAAISKTFYCAPRSQDYTASNGTTQTLSNYWWKDAPGPSPSDIAFQVGYAQKFGRFGLVLGGNFLDSRGYVKDTYLTKNRINAKFSYNITEKVLAGVNFMLNQGTNATYFFWKDSYGGQFVGGSQAGSRIEGKNLRYAIDPYLTIYDPMGNKHKFISRINYVNNDNENDQSNEHTLYYNEYQMQSNIKQIGLSFTTGIVAQGVKAYGEVLGKNKYATFNFAPYLQTDWKIFNKLTFSAGVRHEINRQYSPDTIMIADSITSLPVLIANKNRTVKENRTVFRAGLNYQLAEGTFLRASWGQGYRFPTLGEKFIFTQAAFAVVPNLSIQSETGWSAEIGIKQGVKVDDWSGFIDLAGFVMDYDQMIEFVFGGVGILDNPRSIIQPGNIGGARIWGGEISIFGQGRFLNVPLNFMAGYTYIDPKYKNFTKLEDTTSTADYNILKYRYKHSAKLDIETGYKKLNVGISTVYRSQIEAMDYLFGLDFAVPKLTQYMNDDNMNLVIDARVSYAFNEKIKVSAILKNANNDLYQLRPAKPEAPRNLTLRLDATF